jgi:hypothetical protein
MLLVLTYFIYSQYFHEGQIWEHKLTLVSCYFRMEQKQPQMELTQRVNDTILETVCEGKGRTMPLQ